MKTFIITIIIIGLMILIPFVGLWGYQYFAPKYEKTRREVFLNTPSYQLGKIQEERKIQREISRNSEDKKILENIFDHIKN